MSASFGALNIFGRLIFAFGGTSGVFSAFRFSGSSARFFFLFIRRRTRSTLRLKAINKAIIRQSHKKEQNAPKKQVFTKRTKQG